MDVQTDPEAMAAEVERLCGPREVEGYLAFRRFVTQLYQIEMPHFIDRNLDSPLDLAGTPLLRLLALGGFRRLAGKVAGYLGDPRLRRVFSFQAMYAGVAPHSALALYAVIAYMDSVTGVYFPRGGMHAVPTAIAAAARRHGVAFRYGCEVTRVHVRGGRAVAVSTGDREHIRAHAVVLTPDLPVAYRELLPARLRPAACAGCATPRPASCCSPGSTAAYPQDAHHTITFGDAWEQTFRELIGAGSLMSDPSFLAYVPDAQRPGAGPCRPAQLLRTVPHSEHRRRPGLVGPGSALPRRGGRDPAQARLPGLRRGHRGRAHGHPARLAADGPRSRGHPSAAAHAPGQTGPFRPGNLAPGLDNVVFGGKRDDPRRRHADGARQRPACRPANHRYRRMKRLSAPLRAAGQTHLL